MVSRRWKARSAITGLAGPGHNSVLRVPGGTDVIAYHAWNADRPRRQIYLDRLDWTGDVPSVIAGI